MPFSRPTLTALRDRAMDDFDSRLPGADSRLRRSFLNALAIMHAGAAHGLYGFLDWISRQVMPDTAEAEYLQRWSTIWGVTRKAAEAAEGTATAAGVNGSVIPVGEVLARSDGAEFAVTSEAVIAAGVATLALTAATPGAAGTTLAGSTLSFVSPVAGVNAQATVDAPGLTGGEDEETDDSLRARLLARIRRAPSGGSATDYEGWALEVAGVTRAWVFPGWTGAGSVGVTFVMDGRENIIPLAGDVTDVEAHIEPLRPVTADLVVFAPTPLAVNLTIDLTVDTAEIRAAVAASVEDMLVRDAEPGGLIYLSHIREAISIAAGEVDHVLTVPAANVVCAPNELAVLGVITWI